MERLQPVSLATDCDYGFIHVPLVVRARSITTDALGKMRAKLVHPKPHCLAADDNPAFRQKVLTSDVLKADRWYAQTAQAITSQG